MELSRTLVHCPAHSETHSDQKEGRGLGEGGRDMDRRTIFHNEYTIPATLSSAAADDGLLFDTLHL